MEQIITLLGAYVTGLLEAEDKFISDLSSFPDLEKRVVELSNQMAAGFLSVCLTTADELICLSGVRKKEYTIQRKRTRTLISSIGDVTFSHTLFRDSKGATRCLLDEKIHLPDHERFTSIAEAKLLNEAETHSYQHAAESISSKGETITKTTVMNKVHAIIDEIPDMEPLSEEKRRCRYLYIEADEDHIHRQEGGEINGCHIGKLVYLFEGKEEVNKGRKKLVRPFYFGGIYGGTKKNTALWENVAGYIEDHYDTDYLECVYISGDGAKWIRASADIVDKSRLVADRYHLMKYIYRASNSVPEAGEGIIGEFYKAIYKNDLQGLKRLLSWIRKQNRKAEAAAEECRKYMVGNWESIQTAFHDEHVIGCSAEGHVSNVFSERMSSRPMGWSETGTDRMCKLRCFVRNYGREKVLDLVRYRREKVMEEYKATGTDGMIDEGSRTYYTRHQKQVRSYIERLQATLAMHSTVRKTLAIREQIWSI